MAADLNMDQNFVKTLANPSESDDDYAATVKFVKDYIAYNIVFPKPQLPIKAEENGNTSYDVQEWSFGNGGENNKYYGWPAPASGRIICGEISSRSASSAPAEMKVMIIVNGNEAGNDYIITKPSLAYSSHFPFSTPLAIDAGDRINFRSITSNGSVTHSVVSLIIELDLWKAWV